MNFDKMIEDSQNIVPKRLSFDFLNSSTSSSRFVPKKRKISETECLSVPRGRTDADETLNTSTGSLFTSSWETKLMKSELIEANNRISQLKKEIQHQNIIQAELELKFSAKEKSIEGEKNQYKNKASEYVKILKRNRQNESQLKEELLKVKNQLNINKQTFDQQLFALHNENQTLKENLSFEVNELNNQISELTRENVSITSQYELAEEDRAALEAMNEVLKEKLEEFKGLTNDMNRIEMQNAQMRISALEYEVNSYGDWKELSKATYSRLQDMSEMEKEVERLRNTNKNLHDSLGNKLLLEERVHDLETRLSRNEKSHAEYIELKTVSDSLQRELKDWKQLGVDFSHEGVANNPINLRTYIEKLLHRDLLLTSEKTNVSTEKCNFQGELGDLKNQNETGIKMIENLKKSLRNHQTVLSKLQKKLLMVTAERDSQRQLLENYEKDLTITQGVPSNSTEAQQNRIRIEMLEKTVSGYKELCAKLESEVAEIRTGNASQLDCVLGNTEQYETLRRDLDLMRSDNEKLKKRKNELEIEIENLTLRHNVMSDGDRFKVVHLKINPAAVAQEHVANEVIKLKAEVERLRIRNEKLKAGNEDLTTRINETMNMTMNVKEMQTLRSDYQTLSDKYKENEIVFAKVNQELREIVYMLFGFKLDRYGNSNYRITSMYADNENDELLFQLNSQGTLDMLETEYSKTLDALMDQYLRNDNGSLASFTSALTLELALKETMTTS